MIRLGNPSAYLDRRTWQNYECQHRSLSFQQLATEITDVPIESINAEFYRKYIWLRLCLLVSI